MPNEFYADGAVPSAAGYFSAGSGADMSGRYRLTRLVTRIRAVNAAAGYVDLERPLPFNVSQAWSPRLLQYAPRLRDVGIEDLTLECKHSPYAGA